MINKKDLYALRKKEEKLVNDIQKKYGISDIIYLPNIISKEKVEFILITMEPSFGHWTKDIEDAKKKINSGFKNFIYSWEDFIFHYCITEYLSPSYYLTDISKAAMKVNNANRLRKKIYPLWLDLIKEEIGIIGKEDCQLIFVGKQVGNFFKSNINSMKFNIPNNKPILHYSPQAVKKRNRIIENYPQDEFCDFKKNLSSERIIEFAEEFLKTNRINETIIEDTLKRLNNHKTKLSDSRKKLMFIYYKKFNSLKSKGIINKTT